MREAPWRVWSLFIMAGAVLGALLLFSWVLWGIAKARREGDTRRDERRNGE